MSDRLSDQELLQWLDERPDRLEGYLEDHPEDVDRLEQLTALEPAIGTTLGAAVAPPDDFVSRLTTLMRPDPLTRETASMLAGLFGLPWHTARTLFGDGEGEERP
jgi:hypothetical protein